MGIGHEGSRMHNRNRPRTCSIRCTREKRDRRERFVANKKERVLSVPPGNIFDIPNPTSYRVDNDIPTLGELGCPIIWPLLVQMPCPALKRNGRREENYRPEPRERLHEGFRMRRREMLRDLQRNDEVELTVDWKRSCKVRNEESITRDSEAFSGDPRSIQAKNFLDSELSEDGEPGSSPASYIDDGSWPNEIQNGGHNGSCRFFGSFLVCSVKTRRVQGTHHHNQ